jgi:tetratricopeptide (TPR) repeat protein
LRALISGQAGVAVIIDGDEVVSVDVESRQRVARSQQDWPWLLNDADDICQLEETSEAQAIAELDIAWRKDRSLHLALILLDRETEHQTRAQCLDLLEQFLTDGAISKHVLYRLHVAPFPANADVRQAIAIAKKRRCAKVNSILQQTQEAQPCIARSRQAWDLLPPDIFGSSAAKESFGFRAVESGLFAAISSAREVDSSEFPWANAEVLRRWRRSIKSLDSSIPATSGTRLQSASTDMRRLFFSRTVRIGAVSAAIAASVFLAFLLRPNAVSATEALQLATSAPGVQIVRASFRGFQQELYGRNNFTPYALRGRPKKEAERLFAAGEAYSKSGHPREAAAAYHASNASVETLPARLNEAVALFNGSELTAAETLLKSLLADAERPTGEHWRSAVLTNLGHVYRTQGRFDDADSAYSTALRIARKNREQAEEAANLNNLALVLGDRGKLVRSLDQHQQALLVSEQAGADSTAANSRVNIGVILSQFGRVSEAERNFKSAAAHYEVQGSALDRAYYSLAFGEYMFQFVIAADFYGKAAPKELEQAVLSYRRALELYTSVSNKSGQAQALMGLGQALDRLGQSDRAIDLYRDALTLTRSVGALPEQVTALRSIAAWYYGVKNYRESTASLEEALLLAQRIGAIGEMCVALELLTVTSAALGHPDQGLKYANNAVAVASREGDAFSQAVAYDDLGFFLYIDFHQKVRAVSALERAYDLYSEVQSPLRDQTRELIDHIKSGTLPATRGLRGLRGPLNLQ